MKSTKQQNNQQQQQNKQQRSNEKQSNYYYYSNNNNNLNHSSDEPSSSCSSPSKNNSKSNHIKSNDQIQITTENSNSNSKQQQQQQQQQQHHHHHHHHHHQQQQQQFKQQIQNQHYSGSSPPLSPSLLPQNLTYVNWSTTPSTSSAVYLNHPSLELPPNSSTPPKNRHNSLTNHHNSGLNREPGSSNPNRRSSSNTAALRFQQQQAQARAHAHVHAQLQAHAQAQQVHQLSYYQQHMADLATYITQVFLPSVLPTPEEYQIKEQTRQQLESLADKVSKGAKLLPFGSIASGLALRNSDMDLCYLADPGNKFENNQDNQNSSATATDNTKVSSDESQPPKTTTTSTDQTSSSAAVSTSQDIDPSSKPKIDHLQEEDDEAKKNKPKPTPAEMVMILGQVIQDETVFMVKMLPKARIPIIKLSLPPSLEQPFGLSCDIGFENRLALENTRLLLTYAMVDPRMRTIVLFLKVWSKRRRINDPYLGTLSSYGYVLMVIYYLVNGRKLAVLPNLQQLPPPRVTPPEESVYDGHDIYFFDDLDALPRFWVGMNRENVGELLIEFFRFFSSSFRYTHDVISVRTKGGIVSKESKGWMQDIIEEGKQGKGGYLKIDLNRLCIEDPFQTDYNVARTVTRDGLFTIRGEFMRAVRVLSTRTDRLDVMIRELCEERQEGVLMAPPSSTGRRKSVPNSKSPFNMNSLSREEEEEDDLEEQLLLQQQQALPSVEQQPSYPPLTTRLMQDHIYSQATSSMDARPRYPPESIASEPPPLDRDMDWNHESISNYLSNEIQQLHLQQQQQSSNPQSVPPPAAHVSDSLQPSKSTALTQPVTAQHYFHRFFQTPGSDHPNPQLSTSDSLHKSKMTSSSAYYCDTESLETGLLASPNSIPKHSSGTRRREAMGSEFNQDELGFNPRGVGPSTTNTTRHNSQAMNSTRTPRSMSHSAMNHRRRSEQPQSSNSVVNFAAPPIIMPHSSDRGMPDFSSLPLPGPIRFGNFGTAEKLLKQKIENQQRILGRSTPAGYYPHVNGNPSSSSSLYQQDLSTRHTNASSSSHDRVSSNRTNNKMFSTAELSECRPSESKKQEHGQHRGQMFLAAVNETSRRRSLPNGACSHTLSPLPFDQLSKLGSSSKLDSNEDDNIQQGVETPRARTSRSPPCVDHQSSPIPRMESNETINRQGSMCGSTSSSSSRTIDKSSSPLVAPSSAHLPRKIVFGDVEVSTETAKEVRTRALAAVLRTRRMGSWNGQQSGGRSEGGTTITDPILNNDDKSLVIAKEGTVDVEEHKSNISNVGSESNQSDRCCKHVDPKDPRDNSIVKSIDLTNDNVLPPSVPKILSLVVDDSSNRNCSNNNSISSSSSSSSNKSSHRSSSRAGADTSDSNERRRRRTNKSNKKDQGDCSIKKNSSSLLSSDQNFEGSLDSSQVKNQEGVKQIKKLTSTSSSNSTRQSLEIPSTFSKSTNSELVQTIPSSGSSMKPIIQTTSTPITQISSALLLKIPDSNTTFTPNNCNLNDNPKTPQPSSSST